MYKKLIVFLFLIIASFSFSLTATELYQNMNLTNKISHDTFIKALIGYNQIKVKKEGIIIIIDYNKPSVEKRFYVLDLYKQKILYETLVSHGKNSGKNRTLVFSNNKHSYQSQLGFFKTLSSYQGQYGFSLRLRGLQKGINSNAESRAIVIHGADSVSESFIKRHGFLGRTRGCPAIPLELINEIIPLIDEGVVLFIDGNN